MLTRIPFVTVTLAHVNTQSLPQCCKGWGRQTLWMIVSELSLICLFLICQNFAPQISSIIIAFLQTSEIWRLLWYIQRNKIKMDLVGFLFCFHFYYIPPFTLGLLLLSSHWPDCQAPASDWSILAVGKYLRYLWLFTSSVCYKTIEQSYNKINKTRQITSDSDKNTKYVSESYLPPAVHFSVHIFEIVDVSVYETKTRNIIKFEN